MEKSIEEEASKKCLAHWKYVEGILLTGEEPVEPFSDIEKKINIIEFHYRTAFMHGYKHGREDILEVLKKYES